MIVITGGAGFIGSNLVAALEERGRRAISSSATGSAATRNGATSPSASSPPSSRPTAASPSSTSTRNEIETVFHLGAVSSTTERDADLIVAATSPCRWRCGSGARRTSTRFVYASSAATYGDGGAGFDDDGSRGRRWRGCARSTPMAGRSISSTAASRASSSAARAAPPQWAGLKFFNVYGPNEYHKGAHEERGGADLPARRQRASRAACSARTAPDIADGGQQRDFVWVGDCVDMMLWLYDHRGRERALQCRQRQGAQLRRSRGRRSIARSAASRTSNMSTRPSRSATSTNTSPRRAWSGSPPPATTSRRRRSRTACAYTCRPISPPLISFR